MEQKLFKVLQSETEAEAPAGHAVRPDAPLVEQHGVADYRKPKTGAAHRLAAVRVEPVETLEYLVQLVVGHSPSRIVIVDAMGAVLGAAVGDMHAGAVAGIFHGVPRAPPRTRP